MSKDEIFAEILKTCAEVEACNHGGTKQVYPNCIKWEMLAVKLSNKVKEE